MADLTVVPCDLTHANSFVKAYHRHHGETVGHKFSLAVVDESGQVRGVAIVGRPVARMLDDGLTLEVNRLATDGARNACSILYAAAWRAAKAMGYRRLVTYILESEPGTSLRAAGWQQVGEVSARVWSCPSRPRTENPRLVKRRWEVSVEGDYPAVNWPVEETGQLSFTEAIHA